MSRISARLAVAGGVTALIGGAVATPAAVATSGRHGGGNGHHVLLISVDGLHQSDLSWFVKHYPDSALAKLAGHGVDYTNAQTPFPSDSFPGMVGQVTGGNPKTTGVYYDDTWNRALLPAGTTNCAGVKPGVEVTYFEQLDKNLSSIDAGQGLAGLPGSILNMTGQPRDVIDPSQLPVDPATCEPVYPHSYLKVNTVFDVAKQAGLHTAWSDKHPAYEILNGPSGDGIDDLFTPEINSDATGYPAGDDWTSDNAATQQYDNYKVEAVLNEIDGKDHSGKTHTGVPAIFGLNFQTVSTAQKLPTSDGLTGGYLADGVTPGPLLTKALQFVDSEIGRFATELAKQGLSRDTTVIVSAKHGQSPTKPSALTRINDGTILGALNAAWKQSTGATSDLVAFSVDDDGLLIWLNDRSQKAETFAKQFLLHYSGVGNDINGNPKAFTSSGAKAVYAGAEAASFIGVPESDARVPDIIGIAQYGTVYTGGKGKIAEHGGDNPADRNVPVLVAGAGVDDRGTNASPVETTQIAPTILRLLGLNPRALQAVRIEGTRVLPDLR